MLRSGVPMTRCGERAVVRVLSGVATGAYGGRGRTALRDDARSACGPAGLITAFA